MIGRKVKRFLLTGLPGAGKSYSEDILIKDAYTGKNWGIVDGDSLGDWTQGNSFVITDMDELGAIYKTFDTKECVIFIGISDNLQEVIDYSDFTKMYKLIADRDDVIRRLDERSKDPSYNYDYGDASEAYDNADNYVKDLEEVNEFIEVVNVKDFIRLVHNEIRK